jgi:two-component system, NarL family, nitrate/nitrite response regulator NarL
MKTIRILIADDHHVVRSGLRMLLDRTEGFLVVAEAGNGEEAVRLSKDMNPDVAIIDISMPVMNGVEATKIIKRDQPSVRILVLTIHESEDYVRLALNAGADGYVLKNTDREELRTAVQTVYEGGRFFSPTIAAMVCGNGPSSDTAP